MSTPEYQTEPTENEKAQMEVFQKIVEPVLEEAKKSTGAHVATSGLYNAGHKTAFFSGPHISGEFPSVHFGLDGDQLYYYRTPGATDRVDIECSQEAVRAVITPLLEAAKTPPA